MAWITGGVTHTVARGFVTGGTATLLRGGGFEKKVEGQREQAGRETFLCTTDDSSSEQKHRTAFYAREHARSSYKPAIFMDSGFLFDASLEILGGEDWALAGGGGWVKGIESNGSSSMFGEGLDDLGVQREQDGREAFPGMTNSSIDQQHRTTFCALKHARSSHKPAIFMDSGFLVDTSLEMLEGGGSVAV